MSGTKSYFFCGIGGSGMLPLAAIVRGQGALVSGSDRALDQGRTAAKFDYLSGLGIALYPQDGSGPGPGQILVASAAVEEDVPDVQAARRLGLERITRAEEIVDRLNDQGIPVPAALNRRESSSALVIRSSPRRRAASTSGTLSSTAAEATRLWPARGPLPSCG